MSNTISSKINLNDYRIPGSRIFFGKKKGEEARIASKIDEKIKSGAEIIIQIPDDILSVNPSFLEEFLMNAVRALPKDEFFKKIHFENNSFYNIDKDLKEAIDRIIREDTTLAH